MLYLYILPTSSMNKANNYIKCKWHKVPSMFQETKDPIGMCNNQNHKRDISCLLGNQIQSVT